MYCFFTQLTNSNVLGLSPIRDSNNRETGNCYWWIWQKYNTHVTVKDHIYEYTLTNTYNELYCYSNEFHSHLPFDRPCAIRPSYNRPQGVKNTVFLWCSIDTFKKLSKDPLDMYSVTIMCGTAKIWKSKKCIYNLLRVALCMQT